ncbi:MAG: UDP-N-acetylglucosamine--N-acetylmuramyl-(pentapeptide) pyrophosphoryl-undecaprenol N-acetylglucosamine transferase [Phycisphaerae bacterium]|jgi:UDP-N-acetylglucosamine--N-acetylmuramyl-(pentapeptide) pyrophosphoryl-undecaprenol N-acetylglucosamine transferase|nr:UDP-N-acetylglucosamine--N-acetylmuramyl-(pentapeptide) pyrophosphoryl-undecaprenol N-acetylglucosamine transferase [Phycisphaerae bacterium]
MATADAPPEAVSRAGSRGGAGRPATGPAVLLAGGGTGGHISPGLAIAERIRSLDSTARPIFACSRRAIDAEMLREADAEFIPIPAEPFSLRPGKLLKCLVEGWHGRGSAETLLREAHIRHVVALGGYVTAPVVAAAHRLGVPILLVNLDATPGKANRWVARRASRILSAVPTPTMPHFAERVIGMPIRRIAIAPSDPFTCREMLGMRSDRKTLLVTGASQGATSLNDLVPFLAKAKPGLFAEWQVLHLCGQGDPASLQSAYDALGVPATVLRFQHRMGLAWGAADLALSRAGANSVAEAAVNGIPTLFAPYPYHKDLHQKHNAQPLVEEGAAAMALDRIEPALNMDGLGRELVDLMTNPARRTAMRERLGSRSREDAAATIARVLLGLDATGPGTSV